MPKLLPVAVTRDEIGTWSHPDFKKYWNENLHKVEHPSKQEWQALLDFFGIEVIKVDMENDAPEDVLNRYFDLEEIEAMNDWHPTPPSDLAWFLIAINHTDDGAAAWFARSADNSEVQHV